MKYWVFRNEPDSGYYFCTKVPQPIYGDDMRRVVYTDYGELIGCIPTLTFERLFPALKFEDGGYRVVTVEKVDFAEGMGYWIGDRKDEGSRPTKTKQTA